MDEQNMRRSAFIAGQLYWWEEGRILSKYVVFEFACVGAPISREDAVGEFSGTCPSRDKGGRYHRMWSIIIWGTFTTAASAPFVDTEDTKCSKSRARKFEATCRPWAESIETENTLKLTSDWTKQIEHPDQLVAVTVKGHKKWIHWWKTHLLWNSLRIILVMVAQHNPREGKNLN